MRHVPVVNHEKQVMDTLHTEVSRVKKDLDVISEYEFSEAMIESLTAFIRELEITQVVLLREGL